MNKFINVAITNENGQPVSKNMTFKASEVIQVIDLTSSRQIVLWDIVNQKEVVYLSSTSLAGILTQSGSNTLLSFACNATSPTYAGLTVLLNPSRIINVTGSTGTTIEYAASMSSNIITQAITLTSNTAYATTVATLQGNFNGGGAPAWGSITGTLSAQTDLQTALNGKFDDPTGDFRQYIRGDGAIDMMPIFYAGASIDSNVLTTSALTTGQVVIINPIGFGAAIRILSAVLVPAAGSTVYTSGATINLRCVGAAQPQFTFPAASITNAGAATKPNNGIPHTVTGAQGLDQIVGAANIEIQASSAFATGDIVYNLTIAYTIVNAI